MGGVGVDAVGCTDLDRDGHSVELGADCDDTQADAHPGAADPENDGRDQDCNDTFPRASRALVNGQDLHGTSFLNPRIVAAGAVNIEGEATDDVGATIVWELTDLDSGVVTRHETPSFSFDVRPPAGTVKKFSARCILDDSHPGANNGPRPVIDDTHYFEVQGPTVQADEPTLDDLSGPLQGTFTDASGGTVTGEGEVTMEGPDAQIGEDGYINVDGLPVSVDVPAAGVFLDCIAANPADCVAEVESVVLGILEGGGLEQARMSSDIARFKQYLDDVNAAKINIVKGEWRMVGTAGDLELTLTAGDQILASDNKDSSGYKDPLNPGVQSVDGGKDGEVQTPEEGCDGCATGHPLRFSLMLPAAALALLRRRTPKTPTKRAA